ncbi:MAG TPA: ankyrin repeat domain-containing protein, partial [Gammaproteobacteria bacterium]|nr:ankyrin repeat domain-containing protein [Gammaproteobacteria bacterium]
MHSHHTTLDTPLILAVKSGDESKVKVAMAAMANRVTPDEKNEAFLVACEFGQIEMVKLLFRYRGIDVNYPGGNDKPPITWAIEKNNEALFNFLFEEGKAALNTLDSQGRSLLMLAVIYNRQDFVTRLLDCGLRVEEKDAAGMNAFLYAASDGRLEMMEQFIKISRELINIPNNQNKTALMFAAENGNEGAVNFLLQHDANPNAVDRQDYTALMYVIQMQHSCGQKAVTPVVSALLEKQEKTREAFNKLLCFALKQSNLPILKFLWGEAQKHVNDFNIVTEARAFLDIAAEQDNRTMMEHFLMLWGVDNLNAPNAWGKTPLMLAIFSGKSWTARFLLEKNAEVNVSDGDGNTPLIMAADFLRDEETFNFLLEKKANVAVKNKKGESPLTLAVKRNKTSYIAALLRHHQGSRLTLEDIQYAYGLAKIRVFHEYFKLCHDLQQAVIRGDLIGVKRFIEQGVNVSLPLDQVHLGEWELKRRKVNKYGENTCYDSSRGRYMTYVYKVTSESYHDKVLEPVISSDLTSPNVPIVLAVKHANACPDGYGSIITLLVEHRAEVGRCASLLSDVAQLPDKSSLELLVSQGAQVHPDTLISAIRGGNKENIQYLLEVGVTPHYLDWEQKIQDKKSKKVFLRIFIDHLNEKIKKALFEERDEQAFNLLV